MPDDETVNQMIARHEEEFDLFMVSAGGGWGQAGHCTSCIFRVFCGACDPPGDTRVAMPVLVGAPGTQAS